VGELLDLAAANLLSPVVLFFVLGFAAALARSDLAVPEPVAKTLALYLMLAIGFKGGVALNEQGLSAGVIALLVAGMALSAALPVVAFALMRLATGLGRVDGAAVAAHYGSISVVTFVAGTQFILMSGLGYSGTMVAVMALMETPAIIVGLVLARGRMAPAAPSRRRAARRKLMREIFLNGSVVLLVGAFAIGWATGSDGMARMAPFVDELFQGVLALFLLDMGLVAARRLRSAQGLDGRLLAFGIYMPLVSASIALGVSALLGLGVGDATLLCLLAASASYIAVPAAMRLALPEANPSIYLSLSLGVTFPFNLAIGIPLYFAIVRAVLG
jgi:hypothetical protein